jgi:hypothetical protein
VKVASFLEEVAFLILKESFLWIGGGGGALALLFA